MPCGGGWVGHVSGGGDVVRGVVGPIRLHATACCCCTASADAALSNGKLGTAKRWPLVPLYGRQRVCLNAASVAAIKRRRHRRLKDVVDGERRGIQTQDHFSIVVDECVLIYNKSIGLQKIQRTLAKNKQTSVFINDCERQIAGPINPR